MRDKEKKKRKQKKKNEKETINKQKKNKKKTEIPAAGLELRTFTSVEDAPPRPYIRNNENKKLKRWDDSPETFYEAEASNRLTLRLEISALPRYPE